MVHPLQCSQLTVHGLEVELFRVELAADPFLHLPVVRVLRVRYRFQEIGVARDPAYVLRWTRSCPFEAPGILDLGLWFQRLFQGDLMLPGVTEVVFVGEPDLPSHLGDLADQDVLLVLRLHVPVHIVWILGSVVCAPDDELVQMAILPAHDDLDNEVKLPEREVRHLYPPPDRRVASLERQLELVDRAGPLGKMPFWFVRFVQIESVQEDFQLVEDGSEPLLVRGASVKDGEIDLAGEFVEIVPGELEGLSPSGSPPDLVPEPLR